MNRTNRIALMAAAVLLVVAAGSVLANRAPAEREVPAAPASSHEPESESEADLPPTAEELAHATERLEAAGIDAALLGDYAARYGLGGAVRVLAWSQAAGMDPEDIARMRDGTETDPGLGWGRIAKELDVHPGIGSIMGGGQGRENAPGQQDQGTGE
jgi:hypothetical protein